MTDATSIAAELRAGRLSAVEATRESLATIARLQPAFNAFSGVLADTALAEAAALDRHRPEGPLHGVPVSIKDHIWMAGTRATNGSLALADFVPPEDCVAVARLRAAGAVIVGKTNNPEFCYRGFTDNLVSGLTRNPRDPSRTPGGSSGGAGAAVAGGMTHLALGTDGGGSIRIPASFCGVVGHKPTFGLVPKEPGFKGWRSLSVNGPLGTSVRDVALMLSVIAGATPSDDTTVPVPISFVPGSVRGLRVAYSADLGGLPVDPDVREVFAASVLVLEELGCEVTAAHPAVPANQTPLWNTIALAEGFASEGPLLDRWRDRMSPGTAEIVEAGRDISAGTYVDAQHARARYTRSFLEFFDSYDVLVTPATQLTAFPVGLSGPATIDGRPVDPFFDDWCAICLPANLAGCPATCVPAGVDRDGLPVGLQILGPRFADGLTLRVAAAFEAAVSRPPVGEFPVGG